MGTGDAELRLKAKLEGGKQTADGLNEINEAQNKLTENVSQSVTETKNITDETKKFSSSQSELLALLTSISPALGGFVDAAIRGTKIAGDLAGKNIDVTKAFGGMNAAIKKNAGSFKLLFAGGALLAGLAAIALSVRRITEEYERATKAVRDNAKALNDLKGIESDRQQTIENVADSRTRVGGIDAQGSRDALSLANNIKSNFGGLDQSIIDNTVGSLSGTGLTKDQIEKAAILQQQGRLSINKEASADGLVRIVERSIERNNEALQAFIRRETEQGQGVGVSGERSVEAAKESAAQGGSTLNLQAVLKQFALAGQNIERLSKIAQTFSTTENIDKFNNTLRSIFSVPGRGDNISDIFKVLTFRSPTVEAAGTESERTTVRNALHEIEKSSRDNGAGKPASPTINNFNNQGSTFNGSDAASRAMREAESGIGEGAAALAEN